MAAALCYKTSQLKVTWDSLWTWRCCCNSRISSSPLIEAVCLSLVISISQVSWSVRVKTDQELLVVVIILCFVLKACLGGGVLQTGDRWRAGWVGSLSVHMCKVRRGRGKELGNLEGCRLERGRLCLRREWPSSSWGTFQQSSWPFRRKAWYLGTYELSWYVWIPGL
jgi:hypothetical protein